MTLTLFRYMTLTSDELDTTTKQLAGHVLVIHFDYTSSGSNVIHKSRLHMLAGRHVGFA